VLIPHLLFAHMLADYVLQTNWLVARKSQAWDGLALHGLMVFVMSVLVLAPYLNVLLLPLVVMGLIHTGQDWVKVYTGPRIKIQPFYPYMLDQVLHYALIVILQGLYGAKLIPPPSAAEQLIMAVGAATIAATRFYDVTWWANWLDMIPYMNRWRWWGYAERLAMLALAMAGWAVIAPLCAVLRFVYAWRCSQPIWRQRRGLLEMGIGILFSIALGLVLRAMMMR